MCTLGQEKITSILSLLEDRLLVKKLTVLSDKERKQFAKFVLVQRGVRNDLLKLTTYLLQHIAKETLSDEKVFRHVWGKVKFNKNNLNKLVSSLNQVFDDFLETVWSSKGGIEGEINRLLVVLKFYSERGLENPTEFTLRKVKKMIDTLPHKESFYFEALYRLYKIDRSTDHQDPLKESEIQAMKTRALDKFYFFNKLSTVAALGTHSAVFTNSPLAGNQQKLIDDVLTHINGSDFNATAPALVLWKKAVELIQDGTNVDKFNALEKNLYENFRVLKPKTANDFFVILLNSYVEIEKNKKKSAGKLLEYYLFQIENDIIFEEGYFVSFVFENIVSVGIKVKDPNWVLQFIDDFSYRLHPQGRKGSVIFGRAKCYFYQGKFNKSLEQLLKIKNYRFKNIYINIFVRILRIKAYYEIEYNEPLYDRNQPDRDIASFRKFISNHSGELSDQFNKRFKNFATVMSRMILCTTKAKAKSLEEDIKNKFELIEDRIWLEEKIKELLEGF